MINEFFLVSVLLYCRQYIRFLWVEGVCTLLQLAVLLRCVGDGGQGHLLGHLVDHALVIALRIKVSRIKTEIWIEPFL